MRTVCPHCRTAFQVTAAHLRARSGRVRCGACQTAFNALEQLRDEEEEAVFPGLASSVGAEERGADHAVANVPEEAAAGEQPARTLAAENVLAVAGEGAAPADAEADSSPQSPGETGDGDEMAPAATGDDLAEEVDSATAAESGDKVEPLAGGDVSPPREMPDYRRWVDVAAGKPMAIGARQPWRAPYLVVALLLLLAFVGQALFHFRAPLSIAVPAARPALLALSEALDSDIPLARDAERISIESSDLQQEQGQRKLLALQTTLRNRAHYPQAYPALELTLTDVDDKIIARRVFFAEEYLAPSALTENAFAALGEVDVRLWIEASGINSAGYRLYVFYP